METNERIDLACGSYKEAEVKGDLKIQTQDGDIILREVFYVPNMVKNFISVGKAIENGCTVQFEKHLAKVKNKMGEIILKARNSLNLNILIKFSICQLKKLYVAIMDTGILISKASMI